jgi:hypothetical protein
MEESLTGNFIVLALIDSNWATARDKAGDRRLCSTTFYQSLPHCWFFKTPFFAIRGSPSTTFSFWDDG